MGNEGDGGAQQRGQQLMLRGKLASRLVGEESRDGNADEGVQRVPDKIEGRNFVGEEFDDEERYAGGDDWPACQELQMGWKRQMA